MAITFSAMAPSKGPVVATIFDVRGNAGVQIVIYCWHKRQRQRERVFTLTTRISNRPDTRACGIRCRTTDCQTAIRWICQC